jgi:hypothetical protein
VVSVAAAIAPADLEEERRSLTARPGTSSAICRKLGFTLIGPYESEYPKGSLMQCNDWRLDLFGA